MWKNLLHRDSHPSLRTSYFLVWKDLVPLQQQAFLHSQLDKTANPGSKDETISPLQKKKGNREEWQNYN